VTFVGEELTTVQQALAGGWAAIAVATLIALLATLCTRRRETKTGRVLALFALLSLSVVSVLLFVTE